MLPGSTKKTFDVRVAKPELHHKDNFTMQVPMLEVGVVPSEDEPWGMIVEGEKFQTINLHYEGKSDNKPGYQAAILRFRLQDDYEWFGDGLEIVAIEDAKAERFPKLRFKTFFKQRSDNLLDMTIQATEQRAFDSEIKFRFMACEKYQNVQSGECVKVLVSEDPSVRPNKPIDN